MAVEKQWFYERIVGGGEADGRTCIFCHERIIDEPQAGQWQLKAVEEFEDADFVVEDGYAHYDCTQKRLAESRKSRFTLPDVP